MRSFRLAFVCLVTLVATWAMAQFDSAGQPAVRYNTIGAGTSSPQRTAGTLWIRTEGDLQRYWRAWTGDARIPQGIDFTRESILVATMGERSSGGHRIYVRSAQFETGAVVIRLAEEAPAKGTIVTEALTTPYVAVRFDRLTASTRIVREPCFAASVTRPTLPRPGYDDTPYPIPADYDILATGDQSDVTTQRSFILRTESEFREYVRRYHGGKNSSASDLGADWRRDVVVAIHLGRQTTGGFQMEIQEVEWVSAGTVRVTWKPIRPELGMATQGMTSPFLLLSVPRAQQVQVIQQIGNRRWD